MQRRSMPLRSHRPKLRRSDAVGAVSTSRHETVAVMMAELPESPACFGMFVSYDSVNGLSSRGSPFVRKYSENWRLRVRGAAFLYYS